MTSTHRSSFSIQIYNLFSTPVPFVRELSSTSLSFLIKKGPFQKSSLVSRPNSISQEPTETSKQPIRTRYLGHVTGYQPIRYHYSLFGRFLAYPHVPTHVDLILLIQICNYVLLFIECFNCFIHSCLPLLSGTIFCIMGILFLIIIKKGVWMAS